MFYPDLKIEFLWRRRGKFDVIFGARMGEGQIMGMERQPGERIFLSVFLVAQDGMSDMGHVDAQLMGPSGLRE